MAATSPQEATGLLLAWSEGERTAFEKLVPRRLERAETAEVLRVLPDTVLRDWRLAKVWLAREMRKAAAYDA